MGAPQTTTQFLNTLGVNVHVEYTDGKYANVANVVSDLAYLGVTHARDAVLSPANQGQSSYDALASAGIKFDLFFQGNDLSSTLSLVDAFVQRHPGAVSLIEGPNEVNNFPISYAGLSGNSAATAYQAALTTAVRADATLSGVPVADLTSWPFLSGPSDDANFHFYPSQGEQPLTAYGSSFWSTLAAEEPGKPVVMTEGGYNTLLTDTGFGGVDQITQAKLLLNLFCDNAAAGVLTTYVYQLLDAYSDPAGTNSDDHFGLFNLDNTPKVAATAIHNLTSVLSSGADASAPASNLVYTLAGLPSSGNSLVLAKNGATHDVLVWAEPTVWNGTTHTEVSAAVTNVTLHLAEAANVTVYDPLASTTPIATYTDVVDVVTPVQDHPLVIEVTGLPATQPPSVVATAASAQAIIPAPAATPSAQLGLSTEVSNLLRANAADLTAGMLGSTYADLEQAAQNIAGQLDSGAISASTAQAQVLHLADGTTSVAELAYDFFTGSTPSAQGLNYLVHSDANTSDLSDAYYSKFSMQNRYINFAVSLGESGANTSAYHTSYDGLSLEDATAKAYGAIFGVEANSDKVSALLNTLVSDGAGGSEARAQYFATFGGDGPNGTGTKAAMIGWLLADSVSEALGPYATAETNFLQALAHGSAQFGVDLLSTYASAPILVGQSSADPTIGH